MKEIQIFLIVYTLHLYLVMTAVYGVITSTNGDASPEVKHLIYNVLKFITGIVLLFRYVVTVYLFLIIVLMCFIGNIIVLLSLSPLEIGSISDFEQMEILALTLGSGLIYVLKNTDYFYNALFKFNNY